MKKVRLAKKNIDVFGAEIHLLWPCTEAQETSYISRFGIPPSNEDNPEDSYASHRPITTKMGKIIHVIRLREWHNSPEMIAVLAHECLHATFFVLANRGVLYSNESEETFTYLHQTMVKHCLKLLKAKKFKVLSL